MVELEIGFLGMIRNDKLTNLTLMSSPCHKMLHATSVYMFMLGFCSDFLKVDGNRVQYLLLMGRLILWLWLHQILATRVLGGPIDTGSWPSILFWSTFPLKKICKFPWQTLRCINGLVDGSWCLPRFTLRIVSITGSKCALFCAEYLLCHVISYIPSNLTIVAPIWLTKSCLHLCCILTRKFQHAKISEFHVDYLRQKYCRNLESYALFDSIDFLAA